MIVPGSANALMLGQSQGYNLTKSLRFRSSASAYLSRTPASQGNLQTWTYSVWVKRGLLTSGGSLQLLSIGSSTTARTELFFDPTSIDLFTNNGGSTMELTTSAVYRDPSAWYHLVVAVDTTQATASNRVKMYVNGSQITAFSTANYPTQNYNTYVNSTGTHAIGRQQNITSNYFDGYMAEINLIDGQALTPSSFGSTNATTGVWQPVKYTGTYGTNGFYLPFTDVATTSGSNAGLGKDFSGNGNYWTTNNISVTAGTTYDSMTDVPTLTDINTANYCVLNPLNINYGITAGYYTMSNGNLFASATGTEAFASSTMQMESGKFYAEFYVNLVSSTSISQFGIATTSLVDTRVYRSDGNYNAGSGNVAYGATYTTGDYVGVAVDITNNTIEFFKNGTSQGQKTSISTNGKSWFFWIYSGGGNSSWYANYGQQGFKYTPPTGFVALNTYNLPTSTIQKGSTNFNAVIWTGANSSGNRSITGVGFQPDFVWTKSRSQPYENILYDVIRGAGSTKELSSNNNNAEGGGNEDLYGYLASFDSDGFTGNAGSASQNLYFNELNQTYVAWNWKANGAGVSNTAGSITSTVSANTTAGFSVITFTGNGTAGATIGHGLGVAPELLIFKGRNTGTDGLTWFRAYNTNQGQMQLDSTAAIYNPGNGLYFNSTYPSSSVITLGTSGSTNGNTQTYVVYAWASIAGFSAFGSYVGNGNAAGPFVYTGFRPAYILIKRTDAAQSWWVHDSVRDPYNTTYHDLFANLSNAEETANGNYVDFLSNGVKIRNANNGFNATNGTYVYAAFAENPFKNALAR